MTFGKATRASNVITMFVSDEDGMDVLGAGARLDQSSFKIAKSKTAINEESGGMRATLGFNQSGIA